MHRASDRLAGHARRAFTLVELLVVIGVIAILMAILLPALSRARDSANTLRCLSNMRQLAMFTQFYAMENRDYFPFCQLDATNTKPGRYGMVAWWDYMLTQQDIPHATWQDWARLNAEGSNIGVLSCPGTVSYYWSRSLGRLASPGQYAPDNVWAETRYIIGPNSVICPRNDQWVPSLVNYPRGDPGMKTSQVRRQSQIMLVVDNDNAGDVKTSWAGGWDPAMHLRYRHQAGQAINLAYVDGHAETVLWTAMQTGTNREYDYNLRATGAGCLPWSDPEYQGRKP